MSSSKGPPGNVMPPDDFKCMELLFSHVWLLHYLLWCDRRHWWQTGSIRSLERAASPAMVFDWEWRDEKPHYISKRKSKQDSNKEEKKDRGTVCTRDRDIRKNGEWHLTNKLFISEILISWFMSEPGGVNSYDICARGKQAHNTVPSQYVHLIVPSGVLLFSRHPWPNTEMRQNSWTFQHPYWRKNRRCSRPWK